ncbi:MAG: hypothetical protein ACFFDN_08060 [Candidatus Hodarchaeota archaeon]
MNLGNEYLNRFNEMKDFARSQGGKELFSQYTDTKKRYKFQCKKNHIFSKKYSEIHEKKWCFKCESEGVPEPACEKLIINSVKKQL